MVSQMKPSKYQQAVIDSIGCGHNLAVNAVAGSGKSTLLKMILDSLPGSITGGQVRLLVFGKQNSLDLIKKCHPKWATSISTLHSCGWGIIKSSLNPPRELTKINSKLSSQHGKKLVKAGSLDKDDLQAVTKLVDLLRLYLLPPTPDNVWDLYSKFDLESDATCKKLAKICQNFLDDLEQLAVKQFQFDFIDQLWLPVRLGLKPKRKYDLVLVDECQDLNACQRSLCKILGQETTQYIFVGDPRQSILGFAGADERSYQAIVSDFKCRELPLSSCFRCPDIAINLVNNIYPSIPIEGTGKNGSIEVFNQQDILELTLPGDLILSRKTSPLVSLCLEMLAAELPAIVKGRDISKLLTKEIDAIERIDFRIENFPSSWSLHQAKKIEILKEYKNSESAIESFNDTMTAIMTIFENQTFTGFIQFKEFLEGLFSNDELGQIVLSTIHRAKGAEAERVFLIETQDLPMEWRHQQDWEYEQEQNLHYVALTRSTSQLFIQSGAGWLNFL